MKINLKKNSKVDHQGIRLEFIGQIGSFVSSMFQRTNEGKFRLEMLNDRSTIHEFINLSKLLAYPGELTENSSIGNKKKTNELIFDEKKHFFVRLKILHFQVLKNRTKVIRVSTLNYGKDFHLDSSIVRIVRSDIFFV